MSTKIFISDKAMLQKWEIKAFTDKHKWGNFLLSYLWKILKILLTQKDRVLESNSNIHTEKTPVKNTSKSKKW